MARVVVIGAGASGIAAALDLEKAGTDVLVLEQSGEAGGALRSHRAEGWLFEDGPTTILDLDGKFRAFCADLGVEGELVSPRPDAKIRYFHHQGALQRVPAGPVDIAGTPLLTFTERMRFMGEALVPPAPLEMEETVSAFVARRFGERVAAKFAGAVVSGVFAGDPARLSLDAAFPEVRAIEREHGSLLRGAAAMAGKRSAGRGGLWSLRDGLGRIGSAARARLGARLRTGARVDAIQKRGRGVSLAVSAGGGADHIEADAAILATSAPVAAGLLAPIVPACSDQLRGIEHASLAVVQAGFRRQDLPGLPPGFGFLVPRGAGLESLGWIFLSQVFDGRAPEGCVALLGFFGGVLSPGVLERDDRALGDLAVRELGQEIGLTAAPKPALLRIVRWQDALPQYNLGHRRRTEEATSLLARECAQVVLAGNYVAGISVPRCLESGSAAAANLTGGSAR